MWFVRKQHVTPLLLKACMWTNHIAIEGKEDFGEGILFPQNLAIYDLACQLACEETVFTN